MPKRVEKRSPEAIARRNARRAEKHRLAKEQRRTGGRDLDPGQRLRGVSKLLGPDGKLEREWEKTERDSDDPPAYPVVSPGFEVRQTASFLDGQGQVRAQWITAKPGERERFEAFWQAARQAAEPFRGTVEPTPAPTKCDSDLLVAYNLGDPHIGMLAYGKEVGGENFDLKIAEADLLDVVDRLVEGSPPAERACIANLGDFYHAESDKQTTPTGGNKLDADGRQSKVTRVGFRILRRLIARALEKHRHVSLYTLRGNHDPTIADMLGLLLEVTYENEPRVSAMPSEDPYQYLQFGKCMVLWSHGDGAKPEDLPGIAAADMPEMWGATEFRFAWGGHVHHLSRKDFPGMSYESFRTLAPRDYWHHHKGYRSRQSLNAIVLHREWGEISRNTVALEFSRAARGLR